MAHRKHHRGMKHASGSAVSKTLKERQKQVRRQLLRKGWKFWNLPFSGILKGA